MPYAVTFTFGFFSLATEKSTPNPVIKPITNSSTCPVIDATSNTEAAAIAANDAVINVPTNSL